MSPAGVVHSSPASLALRAADADELIDWLRHYADERLNSRLMDERRSVSPQVVLDFGNRGVLGLQVPRELGGLGLGERDAMRVLRQLGAIDQTLAMMVIVHNTLGIRPILNHATEATRRDLVPLLATGRELVAFAITEPEAGSNPQGIVSRAEPVGPGRWRLHGAKSWSGTAGWAGAVNVFVQHRDADGTMRGTSGFVVRRGAHGFHIGAEALTMGMRAMVQNTVHLDGVVVGEEDCLGVPGAGMAVAQDAMMHGRLSIGATSVGGIERCVQLVMRYVRRRSISTGPMIENPVVSSRVGELAAAAAAIESLVVRVASLLDAGRAVPVEAYVACKTSGPEWFWRAADGLVQLLGGRGYIETSIAPQLLRDARVARILEGPTEALNMFLGSRVVNDASSFHAFVGESLGAADVSARVAEAAEAIVARCAGAVAGADAVRARRWSYSLIGDIATNAMLLAALEAAERDSTSDHLRRCAEWARRHFARSVDAAVRERPDEAVSLEPDELIALAQRYAESIGDTEQTLPGEDHALDEMLRRDGPAPTRAEAGDTATPRETPGEEPTSRAPTRLERPALRDADAVESFIVEWLAAELRMPAGSIDTARSFFDYGLDSVTAVMLAASIEDLLGCALSPEIAYDFSVIRELVAHLVSRR